MKLARMNSKRTFFFVITMSSHVLKRKCSILSELMLPDGAHLRAEDWTIFCLNQLTPDPDQDIEKEVVVQSEEKPLLYVLNLVRTKHDATARR